MANESFSIYYEVVAFGKDKSLEEIKKLFTHLISANHSDKFPIVSE